MRVGRNMNIKSGTQELREAYMKSCKKFIRTWKAKWEKEGHDFPDELMIWAFRRAIKDLRGKNELGIGEFVQEAKVMLFNDSKRKLSFHPATNVKLTNPIVLKLKPEEELFVKIWDREIMVSKSKWEKEKQASQTNCGLEPVEHKIFDSVIRVRILNDDDIRTLIDVFDGCGECWDDTPEDCEYRPLRKKIGLGDCHVLEVKKNLRRMRAKKREKD